MSTVCQRPATFIRRSLARVRALWLLLPLSLAAGATDAVVNIDVSTVSVYSAGFSGFNTAQPRNAAEYWDPNLYTAISKLRPGWLRFPAGAADDAFDWAAGNINSSWMNLFANIPRQYALLSRAQMLTQAKGGVRLSDFAALAGKLRAKTIVCVNGFTDDNPSSTQNLVRAAQSNGLNVIAYELANEAFFFAPSLFANASAFASAMYSPYYTDIISVSPDAVATVPFAGSFPGLGGDYSSWDQDLAAYSPRFWTGVSTHIFPLTNYNLSNADTQAFLNGILAHGSTEYIDSYFPPLIGSGTPIYITEFNSTCNELFPFQSYLYNGIFLAEYIMRLTTHPNVKYVGVSALYMGTAFKSGMIQAQRDYESYLISNIYPNSVDTSGWGFGFYISAPGLAMAVANLAINASTHLSRTTVTGGATVPILGYDGQPIPAVYAQAYYGDKGKRYLVMTNKSAAPQTVAVQANGHSVSGPFALVYVANNDPTAANIPSAPRNVQVSTGTASSTITLPPYCVMLVAW